MLQRLSPVLVRMLLKGYNHAGMKVQKKKRKGATTIDRSVSSFLKILEADGLFTEDQVIDAHRRTPIVMEELRRNERRIGSRGGGVLDPAQVIAHMQFRDADGEVVSEDRIAEVFANHAGFRYAKLDPLKLNAKLVTDTLTLPFARRHTILPIAVDAKKVIVTTNNPYDMGTIDQIRSITKKEVEVWLVALLQLKIHWQI